MGVAVPNFYFLGVTTSQSSVHTYFSRWCKILQADAQLVCCDIIVGATSAVYERFVDQLLFRENVVGSLVTTHKAALYEFCANRFSNLTEDSRNLEEIGVAFKERGGWSADAPDVRSTKFVLARLLSSQQWLNGSRQVVIFGSGGAGLALAMALSKLANPPTKVVLTEANRNRLSTVAKILGKSNALSMIELEYSEKNQQLLDRSPQGSLLVNASGLGKDLPGSPVESFEGAPKDAIVWDFNYRGDLQFLDQARSIDLSKSPLIEDGWNYFISGWAHTMCRVFKKDCTDKIVADFSRVVSAQARS